MTGKKPPLFETLAPITSGCVVAAVAMYPIDVVRALRMASAGDVSSTSALSLVRGFVSAHGVAGLMRQGVVPEVLRATGMRVMQFFCFPAIHEGLTGRPISKATTGSRMAAGFLSTVPSVALITPLENAKIALQLDKEKQFGNSMRSVLRFMACRGPVTLFIGWQGVQVRQAMWFVPYITTLGPFERVISSQLRGIVDTNKADSLGKLASGFAAGTFGAAFNTPFDVVRTNLQRLGIEKCAQPVATTELLSLVASPVPYYNMGATIVKNRGVAALYMGFGFKAMHLGGGGALLAFCIPFFTKLFKVERDIM